MGSYLSAPETGKHSSDSSNGKISWGLSSMQGSAQRSCSVCAGVQLACVLMVRSPKTLTVIDEVVNF